MGSSPFEEKVFDWLGYSAGGPPRHLYALHPRGPNDRYELQAFRSVAERLSKESEYWSQIIRTAEWRTTLIGCTCVLIARPDDRFEDLLYRFEHGSFVSPQLSISMGIVYPDTTIEHLNLFLDTVEKKRDVHKRVPGVKEIVSAQAVLGELNVRRSNLLDVDSLGSRTRHEAESMEGLIRGQWAFWMRYHCDK